MQKKRAAYAVSQSSQLALGMGYLSQLVILGLLIFLGFLKESELFWHNAGGWSFAFREFVSISFYPLLFFEFLFLLLFSGFVISRQPSYEPIERLGLLWLPLLWALYVLVIAIVVANNVDNLFSGRPLHWDPS